MLAQLRMNKKMDMDGCLGKISVDCNIFDFMMESFFVANN